MDKIKDGKEIEQSAFNHLVMYREAYYKVAHLENSTNSVDRRRHDVALRDFLFANDAYMLFAKHSYRMIEETLA